MQIPSHLMSEANIQAHFFSVCRDAGLNCTLELTTYKGRLDAAIFDADWTHLLAIVECKRHKLIGDTFKNHMAQISKYKEIGVPVYGLSQMDKAKSLANTIKRSNFKGVVWTPLLWTTKPTNRYHNPAKTFSPLDLCEEVNYKED